MARMQTHPRTRRHAIAVLAAVAGAVILAACGTPATVKPLATPLPGLGKAVQSAKNVVTASEQSAASYASTTP
jgi:hypothetical protein